MAAVQASVEGGVGVIDVSVFFGAGAVAVAVTVAVGADRGGGVGAVPTSVTVGCGGVGVVELLAPAAVVVEFVQVNKQVRHIFVKAVVDT